MSNLNSLAALIEESAVLKQLPAAYKNKLAHTVYDTLARFNGWAENKTTRNKQGGFIFYVYSAVSENRLQLQIQFRCFYPYSDIIIHQLLI